MGPLLKRYLAIIGLLGLAPIGYLLIVGRLTVSDAGLRGGLIILAVLVLRKMASGFGNSAAHARQQAARQSSTAS